VAVTVPLLDIRRKGMLGRAVEVKVIMRVEAGKQKNETNLSINFPIAFYFTPQHLPLASSFLSSDPS
jgi:hypothetical protein